MLKCYYHDFLCYKIIIINSHGTGNSPILKITFLNMVESTYLTNSLGIIKFLLLF
jgi:hypothetical protein